MNRQDLESISSAAQIANIRRTDIRNEEAFNRIMNTYGSLLDTSRFICRTMRLDIPENQY